MSTTSRVLFDVEAANRVLPLVRTIVRDVVQEFRSLRAAGREQRALQLESMGTPRSDRRIDDLESDVNEASHRIEGYLRELEDLGLEVRDLELGLIDFPTIIRGEPAFLCWRLEEDEVGYWHPAGKGYADRTPVPVTQRSALPAPQDVEHK
jgi:hypothetical protein